jgi:hypothetical protein
VKTVERYQRMSVITSSGRQLSCQRKTSIKGIASSKVLLSARRLICPEQVFDNRSAHAADIYVRVRAMNAEVVSHPRQRTKRNADFAGFPTTRVR